MNDVKCTACEWEGSRHDLIKVGECSEYCPLCGADVEDKEDDDSV